jgi:hypothetical protein
MPVRVKCGILTARRRLPVIPRLADLRGIRHVSKVPSAEVPPFTRSPNLNFSLSVSHRIRSPVDPPRLSAMSHNGTAVVVFVDDIDFRAFWQPNGAVLVDLGAFRRQ